MNTTWKITRDGSIRISDKTSGRSFSIRETEAGFVIEAKNTLFSQPARCKAHAILAVLDMIREDSLALQQAA